MENQHRLIKGFRDLSAAEIGLMNEVKELAERVGQLVEKLRTSDYMGSTNDPLLEIRATADPRCVAHARTQLQDGFMWLSRSVAKPESF